MNLRLCLPVLACLACASCTDRDAQRATMGLGDAQRGKRLFTSYGCQTCHTVQSIPGARGNVGPPLDGVATRSYVAGAPNHAAHIIRFLQNPKALDPQRQMPDLGVNEQDAIDLCSFLYTLH